jgi:transcriptional antiterminator NusG
MSEKSKWYVAHTYSGYEAIVKANIEKIVANNDLSNVIEEIQIPMEDYVEIKDGEKKTKTRKKYPSYVFIKMVMNDKTWFIVRNTRGGTGFVGPESKPVPLTEQEIYDMGVEKKVIVLKFALGDTVKILEGPLENFSGKVTAIDEDKGVATVNVSMFGRDTDVEMDFDKVEVV